MKCSYSSSTELSSSSIQALRVFLSMYSKQLCLNQKVESTESETGHPIRYLYKLMITCSTTPLFKFGHKKQSWNDTVGIWSCHSCVEYSYVHKNGTPHYQQCKGFQKMKENPTLRRCFSFRNWAPNPTRYTSSWSCAVQHLYSNLGTKNNHGMTQLAYGNVTAVKNIHMYIKVAHLITNNAKVSKKWRKTLNSWGISHLQFEAIRKRPPSLDRANKWTK